MDLQEQFRRAALEAGIADDEISTFAAHLRFSIRLLGGAGDSPAGRYGGLPRLPVGAQWPSDGARPLPFVFSVDCAALPRADGLGLPADGSLLFFLNHEKDHEESRGEQAYARVVHVPAGTGTEVASTPYHYEFAGEQYDLHAVVGVALPEWLDEDDEDDDEDDDYEDEDDLSPHRRQVLDALPHRDELRALARALWPAEGLASAVLGGYAADEVVRSIAEQVLAGREKAGEITIPVAKWYSHVDDEAHRLAGEWVSLARFLLDDEFYAGSFAIRHDDLAAARWDRVLSVTRFSE
ncbi:hypothetical protein Asp14428_15980 [Actinoplanes sp. NBRC 14428]|nr:hypothetical protein Asp14428_15980 [Actinoplanes sp. NBRC 14428]